MRKLVGMVAAVAMTLMGCGPTICEDMEDASKAYLKKVRPCTEDPSTFPVSNTCAKDVSKQCSDKEQEDLSAFSHCIQRLPTCSPDTQDEFSGKVFDCVIDLFNKVGTPCLQATGIFGAT